MVWPMDMVEGLGLGGSHREKKTEHELVKLGLSMMITLAFVICLPTQVLTSLHRITSTNVT